MFDTITKRINKIRVMTGPHALGPDDECKFDKLYKANPKEALGSEDYKCFDYRTVVHSYWAGVFWFLPVSLFVKGLSSYSKNKKYRERILKSYRGKKHGKK